MYDRQRELEEEYWYHQNCKWDYLQELKKEAEDALSKLTSPQDQTE